MSCSQDSLHSSLLDVGARAVDACGLQKCSLSANQAEHTQC